MSEPFIGENRMAGFSFAPQGWALCNGQLLSIAQNTALFSLLGTQFGGNGTSNFALPNLQSRVPVHQGQGPGLSSYSMGEATGVESITLNTAQIPAHNHLINSCSTNGNSSTSAGKYLGSSYLPSTGDQVNTYSSGPNDSTLDASTVSTVGGSQPHSNIQPLLVVNFIIALEGIYPSRS